MDNGIKHYAIYDHKRTKKGINFNNARIECDYVDGSHEGWNMQHLTPKGYYSKKPLILEFDFKVEMDGHVEVLILSESIGESLKANYTNLEGRFFQTWWQKASTDKAVKMKSFCDVMHDPYDIG
jgi:hypothetical protein